VTRRSKIKIRLTAFGAVCIFLLVWVSLAATVTGNNFLFILFGMTAGLVLVSHVVAGRNIRSVRFTRKFPEEIFAGSTFALRYLVHTDQKLWGAATVRLNEKRPLEDSGEGVEFPYVPPETTVELFGLFSIAYRGDQSVQPGIISSSFPFGLATYSLQCGPAESVLVFPKIEPIDEEIPVAQRGTGQGMERVHPLGTVTHHFREYVPGDPHKHIDWKKSAHSGRLITRVMADEGAGEVVIRMPENAGERAISRAASLVVHFGRAGIPVSFHGPGISVEAGKGPEFTRKLLTILARWESSTEQMTGPDHWAGTVVGLDETGELRVRQSGAPHEDVA